MYLLDVFPIVKGTWAKDLQYWSAEHISPGSIVKAPLKGKEIAVFVFNCTPLHAAKHIVKEAEFKTRKIENPRPISAISHTYIQSVLLSSGYFVQNIGAMLKACIPTCALSGSDSESEALKKNIQKTNLQTVPTTAHISHTSQKKSDVVALATQTEDRISFYKSIIREEVARNKSVILVAPTVRTAETLYASIKKGIEHITCIIHSGHSKKKLQDTWNTVLSFERGMVIIVTPQYVSIPRHDIEVIILENESSRAYKTFHTPFFDWRNVIEQYADLLGARLILGDQLLRLETIKRVQDHEIDELFPLSYRIQKETEIIVVDMASDKQKHGSYRMLSEELQSMIEYAENRKQSMFLFSARRGLSPQTVCSDCHETVTCLGCNAPVVLHTSKKQGRYFLCHHCGKERTALEACKKCNSWNLTTLGVGTDSVEQEIRHMYPHIPVFRIDKDAAKSDGEAKKIMQEFQKHAFAILIGTETALSYIDSVPHVAVVSMESLFSIPDFRIHERIAHMYIRLLEVTESYLLVQSRNLGNSIIKSLEQRTFGEYVKEELKMREVLQYPPFALMAKIVLKGSVQLVSAHAKKIQDELTEYNPQVFPAMIPSPEGPTIHILFTLPYTVWKSKDRIQTELYRKLDLISRIAPIQVNPESFI